MTDEVGMADDSRTPSYTRKTAWLLLLALFACYLSLSPATTKGRGYSYDNVVAGMRVLESFNAWVKGRPVPPIIWTNHGPVPLLLDVPFIKVGKLFISPDFVLALQPVLLTAGLLVILFLWLNRFCAPGMSLLLTLTGAFATLLWPYAYIGLETKQSFFLFLSGFLGLSNERIRGWPRLLGFAVVCGLALSSKTIGIVLAPAIGYLLYVQFRDDWRSRSPRALAVLLVILAIWTFETIGWNFFWGPKGGGASQLRAWSVDSPLQFFTNLIGLFGSPTKGLFVFAPALLLCIYAIPRAFRAQRDTAIFVLLVTSCTAAFISILVVTADELWGQRFMHVTIAPLLLLIGAACPRFVWRRHLPLVALALVGFVISFLGAFFYYGSRDWAAQKAGQNTLEWFAGDNVWNEVLFDARLFRVWLDGGTEPVPWTPAHIWAWESPVDAPKWKTINLREFATPQAYLLSSRGAPLEGAASATFRIMEVSLVVGLLLLSWVIVRVVRTSHFQNERPSIHDWRALPAGVFCVIAAGVALTWVVLPGFSKLPQFVLNKSEVVAGRDSYTLRITNMPNSTVAIRYSIDDSELKEFTATLDSNGEARFDVGAGTPKGTYRLIAFREANQREWRDVDVTLTVK